MDTMINVWTVVEHARVASGAAELAIFTAILYWFFTSSRVADMLEVVGEKVGGWCGRDTTSLRRPATLPRRRYQGETVYSKLEAEISSRNASLHRIKDGPVVPAPQPLTSPSAGLACARCAPLSRESWHDPKVGDSAAVINILDIGRQKFANGGVVSRYLCDLAQCFNLTGYDYKDVVPSVVKDEQFQRAIEDTTREELRSANGSTPRASEGGDGQKEGEAESAYMAVRRRVEARAMKVLSDISSAMSNQVLRLVAWLCHKAVRRVAGGGCGTRAASVARLRRAREAGLPLVFVPLHRSHFDYILVTFTLYLTGLRPPLVAAGDNMRIPFFGWFLRGCGAFYIRRRVDGSEYHGDPVYKSALRAYILNSLSANNNLEFFIEGGRTRTGKPQPPKAGILSVIMDAYLDGTIDDALLVPVTLNYDRLVDGNFVREQLGMPKQMETFWSALRGIWRTLNTNHGAIRVDFNQPISLKELVTSFHKYNYLKAPIERCLTPPNSNLAVNLDKQILYNHSHSSLYGADVSTDHKMMVEAIGRHLVYDASVSTALMSSNVCAYVLLTELRGGAAAPALAAALAARGAALARAGRDLAYAGAPRAVLAHALASLAAPARPLVRRDGRVRAALSVPAALELSYYANAVVAHYAAPAIVVTALESILQAEGASSGSAEVSEVSHSQLVESALQLCEVLAHEFILCPPCHRLEETVESAVATLLEDHVIVPTQTHDVLEEERWSRRAARRLEGDGEGEGGERPAGGGSATRYRVCTSAPALAERRRLLRTLRPLLEAYAGACRSVRAGPQRQLVAAALDRLAEDFAQNRMPYGEAVSTDAIKNCLRLLRQWGVIEMYTDKKERIIRLCPPYDNKQDLDEICSNVYKFNMSTPLLNDTK